jgi:hypothetical protein
MYASAKVGETLAPQVIALAKLGLSDTEIKQVLADDKRIDKGEKLFELSTEGKEAEKKYKNCGVRTVKSPYGQKVQKEKKVDTDKRFLIDILIDTIEQNCGKVEVINAEREIEFKYNDRKFKITLSAPRK